MMESSPLPAESDGYRNIAARLRALFGDGDSEGLRLKLYDRCQDEAIAYGQPVLRCIKSCASSARTARDPGRYFSAAISRRLREQGFFRDVTEDQIL